MSNIKVMKIISDNCVDFFSRISASEVKLPCSYLFFLNARGRYLADLFFIEYDGKNYIFSKEKILNNFVKHIEKIDIRKQINFESSELFVNFSCKGEFVDPRGIMNFDISKTKKDFENDFYQKKRYEKKVVEFEEFDFEKSIILEYGIISNFISLEKGCYPGQELMNRVKTQGIIRKTVDVVESLDETVIKLISEFDGKFLVLKKLTCF